LGDCFLWAVLGKLKKRVQGFGTYCACYVSIFTKDGKKFCINFGKSGLGYTLGDFFQKLIWSP
jgi:hypothetical protein